MKYNELHNKQSSLSGYIFGHFSWRFDRVPGNWNYILISFSLWNEFYKFVLGRLQIRSWIVFFTVFLVSLLMGGHLVRCCQSIADLWWIHLENSSKKRVRRQISCISNNFNVGWSLCLIIILKFNSRFSFNVYFTKFTRKLRQRKFIE